MTPSSMRTKIEAVTKAVSWLVRQDDRHCLVVTDSQNSQNMPHKNIKAFVAPRTGSALGKIQNHQIHCPGHAGSEVADQLALNAITKDKILMGRTDRQRNWAGKLIMHIYSG